MDFLYLKALHIVFVVTWFAGLFYLCRLYVYNAEANDREEPARSILQAQYSIMIRRLLFGITWPSALITLGLGVWLLLTYWGMPGWLWIKLGFVLLLFLYHYSLHRIFVQQKNRRFLYTGNQLRMWNEVPTVLLIAIVMLVVVKENMSAVYGLLGLLAFVALLMSAIRIYKKVRERGKKA